MFCQALTSRNSICCAVLCQGYILYSFRKKLKAELVGKSQEEIKELRLAGQEVTDTYPGGWRTAWQDQMGCGGQTRSNSFPNVCWAAG